MPNPRRSARFGIHLAGAYLAAMAACAADSGIFSPTGARPGDPDPFVQAAAAVGGAFDLAALAAPEASPAARRLLESYLPGGGAEALAAASPLPHLDPHDPPLLLVCGEDDEHFEQSRLFAAAMQREGAVHEFLAVAGAGGSFLVWDWESEAAAEARDRIAGFLDSVLKGE